MIEAFAVEYRLAMVVAGFQIPKARGRLCHDLQSPAGGRRSVKRLGSTSEDKTLGGAKSGAPGLFSGVADVSGVKTLKSRGVHAAGIGEYERGIGLGGSHGQIVSQVVGECDELMVVGRLPLMLSSVEARAAPPQFPGMAGVTLLLGGRGRGWR